MDHSAGFLAFREQNLTRWGTYYQLLMAIGKFCHDFGGICA
jgi:hypothetical protein